MGALRRMPEITRAEYLRAYARQAIGRHYGDPLDLREFLVGYGTALVGDIRAAREIVDSVLSEQ